MIKGKKIAIIGLGKEGLSAANFLGRENDVTIFDQKEKEDLPLFSKLENINTKFYSENNISQISDFDYIVRSPGIRPDNQVITKLTSNKTQITSSTKLFFDMCPSKIIGVTGTKGKGTTATLIYNFLKRENKNAYIAGNIGTPVLDILGNLKKDDLVVLELSSFQLFDLSKSPHIAVVLMITSEHLDWHTSEDEYKNAKKNIVKYQNELDFAIINSDYPASKLFEKETKAIKYFVSSKDKTNGAYLLGSQIISNIGKKQIICTKKDVLIPGEHNIENVLAAVAAGAALGVSAKNMREVIKTFAGLPHRLQKIREVNGVVYFNDSFSTTPETTIAAIRSFKNPKILILGGSSKNSDFTDLGKLISEEKSIKGLIFIGNEGPRIKNSIANLEGKLVVSGAKNMKEIVKNAEFLSAKGDVVLLSPACASFDMFKNYEDRGNQFTEEVAKL